VALSALIAGPVFADTQDMEAVAVDARAEAQAAAEETASEENATEEAAPPRVRPLVAVEDHHRFVEFGVDFGIGVANNMVGVNDILKKDVVLDFNDFADKLPNGGSFSLAPILAGFVLNVNIGNENGLKGSKFGFGVFAGVDGGIYSTLGKDLFTLLASGNLGGDHNMQGEIIASGGLFAEAGVHAYVNMNRWTFGVRPSVFFPVAYIPTSTLTWNLKAKDKLGVDADGNIKIYTPFDLDSIDVGSIFSFAGFDLTLSARYALFTWLNLGAVANHVPILPAKGDYFLTTYRVNGGLEVENPLSNPSMDPKIDIGSDPDAPSKETQTILRPLTFDVYAEWQIFEWKLLALTVKPNLGFTAMAISEGNFAFNWGVEGQLQLLRMFYFHLGTGLQDSLWRQRAGIAFNFRFFELSLEGILQSQDFLNSFAAQGLGVNVGLRVGF
jgi:hypothetical protein